MENLLKLLASSIVMRIATAPKIGPRRFGKTGCSVLFMNGHPFKKTRTRSGDELYCNEFKENGVTYGVICVEMQHHYDKIEAYEMLRTYMHKLKGPFYVFHSTGISDSQNWNQSNCCTLEDYWQDAVGVDCKVKGYTNGSVLAVLYVRNITEADAAKVDLFLDSFHFGR